MVVLVKKRKKRNFNYPHFSLSGNSLSYGMMMINLNLIWYNSKSLIKITTQNLTLRSNTAKGNLLLIQEYQKDPQLRFKWQNKHPPKIIFSFFFSLWILYSLKIHVVSLISNSTCMEKHLITLSRKTSCHISMEG